LQQFGLSEGGETVVVPHPHKGVVNPFRFVYPTKLGMELFLWALGLGDRGLAAYTPELIPLLPLAIELCPHVELGRVSWS